jgi:hypothetical protein
MDLYIEVMFDIYNKYSFFILKENNVVCGKDDLNIENIDEELKYWLFKINS